MCKTLKKIWKAASSWRNSKFVFEIEEEPFNPVFSKELTEQIKQTREKGQKLLKELKK
jgi:hypothetical protein